jgi:hypothetical protein
MTIVRIQTPFAKKKPNNNLSTQKNERKAIAKHDCSYET